MTQNDPKLRFLKHSKCDSSKEIFEWVENKGVLNDTVNQIDLKSTSLQFETRNSTGEKTSRGHNGKASFSCKVLDLVGGKKGNSFHVFFHFILILKCT